MEPECHALLHAPEGTETHGDALQVPLGPVEVQEELEYPVIGNHDLRREEEVQWPWCGTDEGQRGLEGALGGSQHSDPERGGANGEEGGA